MMTATKPLLNRTAADLMSREVVTIPQAMSLKAAAHRLSQAQITGAPVVDTEGRCVGVLSTTDFMRWVENGERAAKHRPASEHCFCAWQVMDTEHLPPDEVSVYMTSDPVTVTPLTPINELARVMLDGHIHRVFVLSQERRPVGVVSTTDILAAVATDRKVPSEEQRGVADTWKK